MSVRSKALENIRSVMEREDNTYRRENGYEEASWEQFRPEPFKPKSGGKFLAGRFLGVESTEPVTHPEPEPEPESEVHDTEPEVREVIPLKDGKHSWLYNEVVKAINDAARENSGTKIIAVFIPVLQNGQEFDELPVSASVEVTPVSMEGVGVEPALEQATHVDEIIPETAVMPDPELVEAFQTMEEKLDSSIAESSEEQQVCEEASESMELMEESEGATELLPLPDPEELKGFPEIGDELSFVEEEESKGEPMLFEDISSPEILPMPEGLEDDEIEIQDDEVDTQASH